MRDLQNKPEESLNNIINNNKKKLWVEELSIYFSSFIRQKVTEKSFTDHWQILHGKWS